MRQTRLAETDPGTLENFDAFKQRVRNAVNWMHADPKTQRQMTNGVDSMPRRLQKAIDLRGAATGY